MHITAKKTIRGYKKGQTYQVTLQILTQPDKIAMFQSIASDSMYLQLTDEEFFEHFRLTKSSHLRQLRNRILHIRAVDNRPLIDKQLLDRSQAQQASLL